MPKNTEFLPTKNEECHSEVAKNQKNIHKSSFRIIFVKKGVHQTKNEEK